MLEAAARPDILARAAAAGVEKILIPGTTVGDSRLAVEVAESADGLFAAVGVHPHEAKDFSGGRDLRIFEELAKSRKVVAVGEIGLDFHYDHSPREAQRAALLAQFEFARSNGLPVLLHNRESGAEMLDILRRFGPLPGAGVFHSFTETAAVGREAIALGYKISFSGMITFKAAENIREAARSLPLSEMLVETDAPFLAPVPYRGRPCEPAFVLETARKLGEVKAVSLEEVARVTSANFAELFERRRP
jgi:TatD DNase family protein